MPECEMCGSTNMYEAFKMDENYKKVAVDRCNFCGNCNSPKKEERKTPNHNFYNSVHVWVRKHKPYPNECELCGEVFTKYGSVDLELSNITGKLIKKVDNFQYVHNLCHQKYDKENDIKHDYN